MILQNSTSIIPVVKYLTQVRKNKAKYGERVSSSKYNPILHENSTKLHFLYAPPNQNESARF